ncbi:MAG: DNA-binding transcriptional regulator [Sedimentisphaerales bacterium]|nr:DNA-binding transcriptional regulator [Sedimentisphaerales bacterium]
MARKPLASSQRHNAGIRSIKVMLEPHRAYTRGLLEGIVAYARLHGPWLFSFEAEFYRRPRRRTFRTADLEDFDGVVAQVLTRDELQRISDAGIPAVVHGVSELAVGVGTIASDGQAIGALAADHLLHCGLTNFGYCGFSEFYWSREREEGFRSRLITAGRQASSCQIPRNRSGQSSRRGSQKLADWLASLPTPVGVMACNDDCALHVVHACRAAELRVPEDVAIIGVDNDEFLCELSGYPLSSVALATKAAGFEAGAVLHQLMDNQRPRDTQILVHPSYVVRRRSTDILAVEDVIAAQTLRYIKDHAARTLTVEEVADAVAISKRSLQLHCRKTLGRSVNALIQHERIQRVIRLLIETNLSIAHISEQLGFSTPTAMGVQFKKVTSLTPLQYRRQKQTIHAS